MDNETILNCQVDDEHIRKARETYKNQLRRTGDADPEITFAYAHLLTGSKNEAEVKRGVQLLELLIKTDKCRREYVYYLSFGYARLKEYDISLKYVQALLVSEQQNHQILALEKAIHEKMRREGLIGAAILGGAAVFVGAVVTAFFALRK